MVEIKRARNGKGIFGKRNFRQGEILFWVDGVRGHFSKIDELGGKFQDNAFRLSRDYYLSPEGELGDYLNHSCEPNCTVQKLKNKLWIVAITEIEKGTEIVMDYSVIIAKDDSWTMKCNCGNQNCRKVIGSFYSLPKYLRESYKNLDIVPRYILQID